MFRFDRDTFAFANELVWEYHWDPEKRAMITAPGQPPPTYWHRCFVLARSARQFFYHARFDPSQPVADAAAYRVLIRRVVTRNARRPCAEHERITVPGYESLRSFSCAQESLLKAECGRPWESYFLRSHWRMVFPIWRAHQERMAGQLLRALHERPAPVVHLFRFPRISINHGMVLFGSRAAEQQIEYEAYDPNQPDSPATLIFDRPSRSFVLPANRYWAGGPLSVIEIFRGGVY
jgi:hypothetical protein